MLEFLLPAAAAFLGWKGTEDTNDTNVALSQAQMAFQERMSNTAYPRAVQGMKDAGLNPMLAYSQGGASSPMGSMPQVQNPMGAAIASATQGAQIAQAVEQLAKTRAETENVRAATDYTKSQTLDNAVATARQAEELESVREDIKNKRLQGRETQERIPGVSAEAYRKWHEAGYQGRAMADQAPLPSSAFAADTRRRQAEARLSELEIPRAKADAEFMERMGEANPAIRFLLEILRGAAPYSRR
ncbi:MAG: DNA pilot protein [Microvirus sp.]|nr:MAG: DNA pilot protein [Microvirus sp.]